MPLSPSFPEIAALDLYSSVVELGSVGRAARAHGIAQPSASSRLRNLERQLGFRLLDRSPTGSTPTPEGVVVARWTEAILSAAVELERGVTALKAERVGRLRVAASFTIAEYLLPGWLDRFMRDHRGDSVALDVANSATVLERVERGDADLGFVEIPSRPPRMNEAIVATDRLVVVVAPEHEWAGRTLTVEDVASTPLILREQGSGTREALEAALRALDLEVAPALLELGSTAAVRSATAAGNAPTVISRLAVETELERGQLVEVGVDGLDITRRLRAVWPVTRKLTALASEFLAQIESHRDPAVTD